MDPRRRSMSFVVVVLCLVGLGAGVYYGISQLTAVFAAGTPTPVAASTAGGDVAGLIERNDGAGVRALASRGARFDAPIGAGRGALTPLMLAASQGKRDALAALIESGANVNVRSAEGRTALMYASGWGDAACVRLLLDAGARENERSDDGMTPLMFAAARGEAASLTALRNAGADVNARNKWGQTALLSAATAGDPGKIGALLDAGADVNAADRDGMTAIHLAAAGDAPLEALRALLDANADATIANAEGVTPLMSAAYRADEAKVRLLMAAGSARDARDRSGRTAADWAASRDDDQGRAIAELLRTP